jgi:hypothetical protein
MSVQTPLAWVPQQPSLTRTETSALGRVIWFGANRIAGLFAGRARGLYASWTTFAPTDIYSLPANATPSQVSTALSPIFQYMLQLIPVVLVVEVVVAPALVLIAASHARGHLPAHA